MKMAKPSANDIAAAEELMHVLQLIDARFGGPWSEPDAGDSLSELLANGEEAFDSDSDLHLRTLYNNLARLLRDAPNFHGRVISGMCHVIMFEMNQILDPDSDCIDLHPRFAKQAKSNTDLRSALAEATECLKLALTGGQVPAARAGRALVQASELLGTEQGVQP
ncbi:hypothetical protein ACQKC8_16505 [Stutzerimonas stutzeri]|uniref:hypothetical protein n=1 Tax=Stutzerimonas stutzeri TaxID=316 RepID=UPI003C2CCB8B